MEAQTLGWTIAAAVLAALTLIASIWFGSRTLKQARAANQLATERSVVEWQIQRLSPGDAGRFGVFNVGHDTAYEVTVEAWDSHDRVKEFVTSLTPHELGAPAECIEFTLKHRSENGPDVEAAEKLFLPVPKPSEFPPPAPIVESIYQQHLERIDEVIRKQVHVEITWRSKLKRWSSEITRTG